MISEGEESENFFWVGIGGKKFYDKVYIYFIFVLKWLGVFLCYEKFDRNGKFCFFNFLY